MTWHNKTKDTVHDEHNIKGFSGNYRWLSNFEPCAIEYFGLVFQSTEAAYQAAKCCSFENMKLFISLSASESKNLGRRIEIRKDWDKVKVDIMREILKIKFSNANPYLKEKLANLPQEYLEETNWWGDKFWGVCNGVGENHLGKLLIEIRKQLQ